MKALIKVVAKDTNAILVGQSAKIITQIANGLRKDFHPYASETVKVCLEKFKEKKPTVLSSIRSAADSALKAVRARLSNNILTILSYHVVVLCSDHPGSGSRRCDCGHF